MLLKKVNFIYFNALNQNPGDNLIVGSVMVFICEIIYHRVG